MLRNKNSTRNKCKNSVKNYTKDGVMDIEEKGDTMSKINTTEQQILALAKSQDEKHAEIMKSIANVDKLIEKLDGRLDFLDKTAQEIKTNVEVLKAQSEHYAKSTEISEIKGKLDVIGNPVGEISKFKSDLIRWGFILSGGLLVVFGLPQFFQKVFH